MLSRRSFLHTLGLGTTVAAIRFPAVADAAAQASQGAPHDIATDFIRLDRNENPYGPSPRVAEAMRVALSGANRYPTSEALVAHIAQFHHVQPEQVVVGCGSSEILRAAACAFLGPGTSVVVPAPSYEEMTDYAQAVGARITAVPLAPNFEHDLNGMLNRQTAATTLVYICNPNNPTATVTPRPEIESFIAKLSPRTHVLIDEAYYHYAGQATASFLDHPSNDPRVIVSRTFSAVYGLAGLRLGYAVAAPDVAGKLRSPVTANNINAVAAHCATVALQDSDAVREFVQKNADTRQEFMNQAMARMLKPIDSHANFVMMNTHHPVEGVIQHFRQHHILVGRRFPPLDTYLRVSLGTPEQMKAFWQIWDLLPFAKTAM